jgi:hypothetical protein
MLPLTQVLTIVITVCAVVAKSFECDKKNKL